MPTKPRLCFLPERRNTAEKINSFTRTIQLQSDYGMFVPLTTSACREEISTNYEKNKLIVFDGIVESVKYLILKK